MGTKNSFDLMRLAAAMLVIFHHGFVLAGHAPPVLGAIKDLGGLGVGIFFVISGYLIAASFERSADIGVYLAKRVLRIAPALIVMLLLTAFVLGPLITTLSTGAYLTRPEPWLYVVRNTLLYPVTYALPGVFEHNPFPVAVNGSLWTLRLEFTCYLGIALLGAGRALKGAVVAGLALAAAAAFLVIEHVLPNGAGGEALRLIDLAARNGFLFLAGAWFHLRGRKPGRWETGVSAVLLLTPVWILGLPAVVLALGHVRGPKLPADISYGLYVYAFPIQQVLASLGWLTFPASLLATLPLAIMSWYLVEKPALTLKRRLPHRSEASSAAVA
jgi:peptidoglycan/LPS O-acetylase OafA/YrhL